MCLDLEWPLPRVGHCQSHPHLHVQELRPRTLQAAGSRVRHRAGWKSRMRSPEHVRPRPTTCRVHHAPIPSALLPRVSSQISRGSSREWGRCPLQPAALARIEVVLRVLLNMCNVSQAEYRDVSAASLSMACTLDICAYLWQL